MTDFKAAFNAAAADISAIIALLGFSKYPGVDPVLRAITNLVLAKAEAQAHREELARINSLANCGSVQNWLKLNDEDKAKWFELYRRKDDENVAMRRELAELRKDKDRLDSIEGNCWDVRYDSSPNADAGDSSISISISIEIIGHYQGEPHIRVLGENYTENLRAAIDQAMTAEAYPPARPEYDDHGRPVRATKSNYSETWPATKGAGGCDT